MLTPSTDRHGFTIVELLIVVVVIAILATISTVAYTGLQARARDAARISKAKEIATALELYMADNNQYPPIQDGGSWETSCGSQTDNWGHCDRMKLLSDYLAPYAKIDPVSLSDATGTSAYYNSASVGSYQTYGFYIVLEGNAGQGDRGYYQNAYEIGQDPPYCMEKYTVANSRWGWSPAETRCIGGS